MKNKPQAQVKKNEKYKMSPTFKIGTMLILILSAFAILGGVLLFVFGMSWVFMGTYDTVDTTKAQNHITWGIVMMVIGSYIILANVIALLLTSTAVNTRSTRMLKFIAISAIIGIIAMPGGITLLFTPQSEINAFNKPEPIDKSENMITVTKDVNKELTQDQEIEKTLDSLDDNQDFFTYSSQDNNSQELSIEDEKRLALEAELKELKSLIDEQKATSRQKDLFIIKMKEYKEKYSNS